MFAKIEISGTLEVLTGLHIGGSEAFSAIGAVDSPVIRDSKSRAPMIPGSSLKGKMRTLLARQYNEKLVQPGNDDIRIRSLFGSSNDNEIRTGRLLFSDMYLTNGDELKKLDINPTEVKFENSINRLTAVANPRQIERVVRGAKFGISLIYETDKESSIEEDFRLLADGIKLLSWDYLGGSGTRGYGKLKFCELEAKTVIGEVDEAVIAECNKLLKEAARG